MEKSLPYFSLKSSLVISNALFATYRLLLISPLYELTLLATSAIAFSSNIPGFSPAIGGSRVPVILVLMILVICSLLYGSYTNLLLPILLAIFCYSFSGKSIVFAIAMTKSFECEWHGQSNRL